MVLSAQQNRLEITLEKHEADAWQAMDPQRVFEPGDRVRFRVRPDFAGYLYVMNQATSGSYTLLFPREDTGRMNRIEAGREFVVPANEGSFRIGGPAGHEIVYWLVSPVELGGQGSAYPALRSPPRDRKSPARLIPRCDETILRARGDCVDTTAGAKPSGRLPENLAAIPGAGSRDLVFVQKKDASVVAAPARLDGPVVFEFRLAHR